MLRKRSRAVTSKQALMADHGTLPSPTDKYRRPFSSFFSSPRLFTGFSETESVMSPTSILDGKLFSCTGNPLWSEKTSSKTLELCLENRHPWEKLDSRGVGLGLVDALNDERTDQKSCKPDSRMVLFGSQLKIQIPPLPSSSISPTVSPKSPADFGISSSAIGSVNSGLETPASPGIFTGCLSASEMELSEDYTCVISHGPNPKTTHIFDNCVVESCCGVVGFSASRKGSCFYSDRSRYPSENFLSFCYTCKKNLGQGKDIYMYRGEKAFCSSECRYQEMLSDERMEKSDLDDGFRNCS